jgi:AcrR family transcriptional regulator
MFEQLGQDTRSRILRGAFDALAEHGVRQTSVQHVLETSQVSRRTFYQYFRSMDGVKAALYEIAKDELVSEVRTLVDTEPNPAKKAVKAVNAYVEYQRRGGAVLIGLQAEAIRADSPLAEQRVKTLDALVEVVDKGTRDSLGVGCDTLVYRSVLMGIEGMVLHLQSDGSFTEADSARTRQAGIAILLQVLAGASRMPLASG